MSAQSASQTSQDPLFSLIDPTQPEPNVQGRPLWMLPSATVDAKTRSIIAELHRTMRAQMYLAEYARMALDVVPALHHRVICEAIDGLLNDEYDDLVINTPPGSAKSTYTSHALGSYFLGRFPKQNIILATHTADLSERWSRKVRATLASAEHARVFPASRLS